MEDISLNCSKNHQVNTSFILLLQMDETFCCYELWYDEEDKWRKLYDFEIENYDQRNIQSSQKPSKLSMD